MKPLDGVTILDLSRILAGPFASMILGDFGAEIIKIENPDGGDDTRAWGPPFARGESAYFLAVNRNKKSVTLNLKDPEGKKNIRRLAATSDVLLENFRPGTLEKLSLGYEDLWALNPRLIFCSISGYGLTGPEAHRAGYDLVAQGLSGIMDITGGEKGPPTKVGTSIADLVAGLYAVQGILLALFAREKTGRGQKVDVSLLDGMVSLLAYQAEMYLACGKIPRRMGNQHPTISPYETFQAKDGYLNIAVGSEKLWSLFCDEIGMPKMKLDKRFLLNKDRVKNRNKLFSILSRVIRKKKAGEWLSQFEKAGIPAGPILSVEKILNHPQILARQMVQEVSHKRLGGINLVGIPVKLSGTPGAVSGPPPILGEHTKEVLDRLSSVEQVIHDAVEGRR